MQKFNAKININMGLGQDNPVLKINNISNIAKVVRQFVENYELPPEAESVILSKVEGELKKQGISPIKQAVNSNKENYQSASTHQLRKVSPFREKTPPTSKPRKVGLIRGKNSPPESLNTSQRSKSPHRASTPLRLNRTSKTPLRVREEQLEQQCINKIFDILMRKHPKNIMVLCPEFVCFDGLGKHTLNILQHFFEEIQEEEYGVLDRKTFRHKLKKHNYAGELVRTFNH